MHALAAAQHGGGRGKFAATLYNVRSDVAHGRRLLRADEQDAGFNAGGGDDQSDLERGVLSVCQRVLLNWLWAQSGMATLPPLGNE